MGWACQMGGWGRAVRCSSTLEQCIPAPEYDRIYFIVTSRPGQSHGSMMNLPSSPYYPVSHYPVSLDKFFSAKRPKHDIRTFFRIEFTEIHHSPKHRLTMSNVAKPWPSYRVLDELVDKVSGQFIYPATVLNSIGDPNYRPTDRLDIIVLWYRLQL